MADISSLKSGDCVVCRINDNYASGKVFVKGGKKYLANNDYAFADTPASTQRERFGYRLAFPLDSILVSGIKKVAPEKLPYKTKDILVDSRLNEYKILGRCGALHILSKEDSFDEYGEVITRKELDDAGVTLKTECDCDEEDDTEELTMEQVCAELGRNVKIRRA